MTRLLKEIPFTFSLLRLMTQLSRTNETELTTPQLFFIWKAVIFVDQQNNHGVSIFISR